MHSRTGFLAASLASLLAAAASAGEIHQAVNGNNLKRVKALIEKDPSLVNSVERNTGYTPLHYAIQNRNAAMVKYLLSKKADVNKPNRYQQTPLYFAVTYTYNKDGLKVLDLLLAAKPKIDQATNYGYTALMYAAQYRRPGVVEKLLKAGADVNKMTRAKQTVLHLACQSGNAPAVKLLLASKNLTSFDDVDSSGGTPLYYACNSGNAEIVKALLKKGAKADRVVRNSYQPTPLFGAARVGNAEMVKALLARQAKVNYKNNVGDTPLHFAAQLGGQYYYYGNTSIPRETQQRYADVIDALLEGGADANLQNKQKQTPLQLAVARDNYLGVNSLLPKTKDVKTITPITGESFFLWCCRHGLDKALPVLLKKEKVNLGQKTSDGETALVLACEGKSAGHANVVKLLLAKGADVNQKLDTGETVLHVAAFNGNAKMVQVLLKAKANVAAKDKSGYTPLHLAAWNGHAAVVAELLNAGAKADTTVNGGYTPLHAAAWKGQYNVVKLLLDNKANVNAKDSDGLTPLHKAAWNGHLNVVRLLVESGANVNAKDNDGYTPLVKAREQKKTAVVVYLKSKGGVDTARN
jgi:ankyrin repeat protein